MIHLRVGLKSLTKQLLMWYNSLTGNNIPPDIMQALSVAVQQNNDRQVTFEEHRIKTEALTRELEMVHESKRLEVR